jgi:hypothetical protein
VLRVACFATPVPLAVWWLARTHDQETQVRESIYFDLSWSRLGYLGSDMVGLDAGAVYATLGWLALTLPWFAGARFAKQPHRWLPLVLVVAAYLFGPTRAFGTHFIANRFTYFIMPLYLFALTRREQTSGPSALRREQTLEPAGVQTLALRDEPLLASATAAGFAAIALSFFARDCYQFSLESSHFQAVRYLIEPGKKALYMPFLSMSAYSPAPAYLHFGSYYTAEKLGDVDFNFAQFYPQMVRLKVPKSRPIDAGFSFAPGRFDWRVHRGDNYDYFIVRSATDPTPIILKHARSRSLKLVLRRENWWLLEKRIEGRVEPHSH